MNNKLVLTVLSITVIFGMIIMPEQCISSGYNSLKLCAVALIPTLLPFFICIKLLLKTGFAYRISKSFEFIMRPMFNLPGEAAFAFVMGLISGYPMGAKCACQLYEDKICTLKEAERITFFCNNSGPIFIIGTVGVTLLGSKTAGAILLISHVLSALTVGMIVSINRTPEKANTSSAKQVSGTLSEAVTEALNLILYVCGFVVFFNIMSTILDNIGLFDLICLPLKNIGINSSSATDFLSGIVEMTGGISRLSVSLKGNYKLPLISFLLGFGGLSVIVQISGITEKYSFSIVKLISAKLMQGVISLIYTMIILLFPISVETGLFIQHSYSVTGSIVCGVFLMIVSISVLITGSIFIKIVRFVLKRI